MSIVTYPLNETLYTAEDAAMYNFTISSGVASGDDFACSVSGGDNIVTVSPGIGWIKNNRFGGIVVGSKTQQTVDIGLPDAIYSRIDVVALQFDVAKNGTSLIVKKGTPAANPSIPERSTTESIYELYLCSVLRNPSATVVSPSNVTDLRMNSAYCGLMANSITKIDTDAISQQVNSLIDDFRTAIADVEAGEGVMTQALWTQNGAVRVDKGGTGATTAEKALENLGVGDYIIEIGTEESTDEHAGTWYWEKRASGTAVCFGNFDFGSVDCNLAWDELHQSGDLTKSFPSELFATVPYWNVSYVNGDGSAWVAQQYSKNKPATASGTGAFNLVRANKFTLTGVLLGFFAVGRWK
jgi:hypothetical protein